MIVLDADGGMRYASPNAVSSLHRLGIHAYTSGVRLGEIGFDEAAVDTAVRGRLPVIEEVEREEASVLVRVIPLMDKWKSAGALVLLRDVTDLRRRDRMLMSKDATIREIHHRVKNNLQTIASLLRLQGRRVDSKEARTAIQESERRIRSIAIVHETLSREAREFVDFGQIVKPLTRVVEESVSTGDGGLRFEVVGEAGELPGELATPLAVVLNELMQNAVDHAFPREDDEPITGTVQVRLHRADGEIDVDVVDDGVGLAPGFDLDTGKGLGLSIVQALVTGELGGTLDVGPGDDGVGHEVPRPHPAGHRRGDPGGRAELSRWWRGVRSAVPAARASTRRRRRSTRSPGSPSRSRPAARLVGARRSLGALARCATSRTSPQRTGGGGERVRRRRPSGRRARSCGACGARPRWCRPRRPPPGWWRGRTRGTRG